MLFYYYYCWSIYFQYAEATEQQRRKKCKKIAFTCLFHSLRVMKCALAECTNWACARALSHFTLDAILMPKIPVYQLACVIVHCARQNILFISNHTNWLTDYFRVLKITRTHLSRRKIMSKKREKNAAHKIKLFNELHSTIVLFFITVVMLT